MSRQYLVRTNIAHYRGELDPYTPYSSWSSSLPFVMAYHVNRATDVHISIVNTSKLPYGLAVLFTPAMQVLDRSTRGGNNEFMIYGPVSGESHGAVAMKDASEVGQATIPRSLFDGADITEAITVAAALRFGKLFGFSFMLPFEIYMLTVKRCTDEELLAMAQALESDPAVSIPTSLASDLTIMTDIVFTGSYPETERALKLMRHLATMTVQFIQTGTAPSPPGSQLLPRPRRNSGVRARSRSRGRRAAAVVVETDRVSPQATKLYVEMIGWEEPAVKQTLRPRGRSTGKE